jgi:hypothetical protein
VNALHDAGWDTALSGSYTLSPGLLYLMRLPQLAHDATLLKFGAYGNNSNAVNVELAVYADNGSGTAPSGSTALATISSAIDLSNATGGYLVQDAFQTVTLNASTWYWLGIIAYSSTTIYSQTDNNEVGTAISATYGMWPAGSSGLNKSNVDLAIFINVQDLN